jgi:S1-C subfamily serine protease
MAESTHWSFPSDLQPRPGVVRFDLNAALDSVVQLRADVPDDAFTASILGTERTGNGVVIADDGLVLTIGYLITEAQTVWLTSNEGKVVQGYPLAYDFESGFGLVQPLGRLDAPALTRGSSADIAANTDVLVIGNGGIDHALQTRLIAKREFAGYWEYVLDEALFTSPAHPEWSGAALVDGDGKLLGIGSLYVQEVAGDAAIQGNMFVPVDLLTPILHDLMTKGRRSGPARPWLGIYPAEVKDQLIVTALARGGPGERAGMRAGDVIVEVDGTQPSELAPLFRTIWALGPAGTEIVLTVMRDGSRVQVHVKSADRGDFLKKPVLQ